jgi:hypothetical protein
MMNLRQKFNYEIKPLIQEKGFRKNKDFYYRVTPELLQGFYLKIYSCRMCDIYYSVLPIRGEIEEYYLLRPQCYKSMYRLVGRKHEKDFYYTPSLDQSVISCTLIMVNYFETYILPFFNIATTCDSALKWYLEHEKFTKESLNYLDYSLFELALNTGNYDIAIKCCNAFLANHSIDERRVNDYSAENLKRLKDLVERDKLYIKMLKEGNYVFFDKLLNEKEISSREILSKYWKEKAWG